MREGAQTHSKRSPMLCILLNCNDFTVQSVASVAMMELIRIVHSTAGGVVAITGLLQILLPKGGLRHRILGQLYFWSWILIVPTGAMMGSFLIALFGALGLYMAFTGYRIGVRKKVQLAIFDKLVIVTGFLCGLATLGWGVALLVKKVDFGIVGCFFGVIFCLATLQDIRMFLLSKGGGRMAGHPMHWMFLHYGRMYISYIAAMTAFTVIQQVLPWDLANWILPTVLGTALLIFSGRFYRKKFGVE